jgi:hypothetical protein
MTKELDPRSIEGTDYVARQVMKAAGIDFEGYRIGTDGDKVLESATDSAVRMADIIRATHPGGIQLLREVGLEV